jgi:D-alanyl-D-alanine carboxypeptidase
MNSEYIVGEKRIIVYIMFIVLGIFISTLIFLITQYVHKVNTEKKMRKQAEVSEKMSKQKKKIDKVKSDIFSNLNLGAQAVYIKDLTGEEVIFSKNENKKLGIASLTKIASADVAIETTPRDNILKVNRLNLLEIGDDGLILDEEFSLKDIIIFMMTVSSNDVASVLTNYLGKELFIEKMNFLADKLNLRSTLFFSESGLDISDKIAGSYSTAFDVARLVEYFYNKYSELSGDFSKGNNEVCSNLICHKIRNTNKLLWGNKNNGEEANDLSDHKNNFPYKVYFSKTGYTEKTGGSLAMVVEIDGHKILAIVLASGKESRFSDMEKVLNGVEKYLKTISNLK